MSKNLISFDLDGTLVDPAYTTFVWEIGIGRLYAEKQGMEFSDAVRYVRAQYDRIGDESLEWYDISYWFDFLKLPGKWEDLLEEHRGRVQAFPELKEVIEDLIRDYDLIIISNAAREFVDVEIRETGIAHYFKRIFSATSDFGQVKKNANIYQQACKIMEREPAEVIHVGDHYEFDYVVPKSLGMNAYYLDRNGETPKTYFTVKTLREFAERIKSPSQLL